MLEISKVGNIYIFILKTLVQIKSIDRIIVSTEDIKIKKVVKK